MKITITEEQLDKLQGLDTLKKMVFKYWDKNGIGDIQQLMKFFSMSDYKLNIYNVYSWIREYLGMDKVYSLVNEYLEHKKHTIDDCGGYEFDFFITNYKIEDDQVEISVLVDDINGSVILIMTDGTIRKIKDAREEEFGWEIESEVEGCMYDYLEKNMTEKFGIQFVFEKISYISNQKNES